jgi:hypothetical protein
VEKTLAYYEIWPFAVNYESVMFSSTGPRNGIVSFPLFGKYLSGLKRVIKYFKNSPSANTAAY